MMNFRSEGKALALAAAIAGGVLLATLGAATVMRGRVQSQQHLAARTAVGGGSQPMMVAAEKGRQLFLQSCAHCHGDDARGDDGPDLHNLRISDAHVALLIKNGIKGDMPSFAKKHDDADIAALTSYLRTLH